MKTTLCFFAVSLLAHAATISLSATSPVAVGSSFDVVVQTTNVFAGRSAGDLVEGYGFNVSIGNAGIFKYLGETPGALFTDVSGAFGGTPMVAGFATSLAGIGPADFSGPLMLATLRFTALAAGTTTIGVTSSSNDLNQGLIFANLPYGSISAVAPVTASIPEPGTLLLTSVAGVSIFVARLLKGR